MTIFVTTASTMRWNSTSSAVNREARAHTAARPSMSARASALVTGIMAGMSRGNSRSGTSRSASVPAPNVRCGIMPNPAAMESSAAPKVERYAASSATPRMRDTFSPSFAMEGAMKPMMMSGTQNMMTWRSTSPTVATTAMTSAEASCPKPRPIATATSRMNGRLVTTRFAIAAAPCRFVVSIAPLSLRYEAWAKALSVRSMGRDGSLAQSFMLPAYRYRRL